MKAAVEKHILPNGLRVVLAPRSGREALAVNILVLAAAGSKYETPATAGLSHFLEHLCFKGTKRHPRPLDISMALDALGASYNAFTSQEFTGYYATVEPRKAPAALRLVAELYLQPTLPAAEIEKEKGVIVEEINMYEDMPAQAVHDLLCRLLYGGQPAGWSVLGTKETVRSLGREELVRYREKHYVAPATTVVAAGDFRPEKILPLIAKEFGSLPATPKPGKPAVAERQSQPEILVKHKASDQTHLLIGLRGRPLGHQEEDAARVLAAVLGGGMSSRLWRRVREELGAAYYVEASHEAHTDHGIFQMAVGADTARVKQIIAVALEEARRLTEKSVPSSELSRVKEALVGRLYLALESAAALGQFYGFQELLEGKIRRPAAVVKGLRAVSAGDLKRLAGELFRDDNLNLALIGPFSETGAFVDVLHFQ